MPTGEQFGTNAPQAFTTTPLAPGATTIPATSFSGWPSTPFTAILGIGTALQEAIYVTNIVLTNATVTRGYDGTTAQNHPTNQTITHGTVGVHFREPRSHIDSAGPQDVTGEAVHGLTNIAGNVVMGTKETQTVLNKSLTSPAITGTVTGGATYNSPALSTPTTTGGTSTNETIVTATFSGNQAMGSGAWSGTGSVQEPVFINTGRNSGAPQQIQWAGGTIAGGPPTSGTFVLGDVVFDALYKAWWYCTAAGTPGTWALANGKCLIASHTPSGATDTFSSIPQIFRSLRFEYELGSVNNTAGIGPVQFGLQFNGISTATYNSQFYGWQQGGTAPSAAASAQTSIVAGYSWNSHTPATGGRGYGWIEIPAYTNGVNPKTINWQCTSADGGTGGTPAALSASGGGTAAAATAITSVTFTIAATPGLGGNINLYGIV